MIHKEKCTYCHKTIDGKACHNENMVSRCSIMKKVQKERKEEDKKIKEKNQAR